MTNKQITSRGIYVATHSASYSTYLGTAADLASQPLVLKQCAAQKSQDLFRMAWAGLVSIGSKGSFATEAAANYTNIPLHT